MPEHEKSKKLFTEFPPVSTAEWEEKIMGDLAGADYEKKLVWDTGEGFRVRPYYREEDLSGLGHLGHFPGEFPFVRGKHRKGNPWHLRQDIVVKDLIEANEKALDILMKGVDSLGFIFGEDKEYSGEDLDILLRNIFAEIVEINFECGRHAPLILENHVEMINRYNRDFQKIYGSVNFDPLGRLVRKGNFYFSEEEDFGIIRKMIVTSKYLPHLTVINVRGDHHHHAGAPAVEELAFSLAAGAEYLTRMTERELSVNEVAPKIKFTFGIGSNYFLELAKIRAARMLWAHIVKAYGPNREDVARMNSHAVTSGWNMGIYDPYVNMLRTTTESMSAIIAGIDSLTVRSFNSAFEEPDTFSERIARNQQLLLKEESYLDRVADPAAGSYYIENLTDAVAGQAWKLFLEVDSMGGYLEALKKGFIQEKLKESARRSYLDIANRKENLLGINQYPNFSEHIDSEIAPERLKPSDQTEEGAIVETLKLFRGGMAFEELRYRTDRYSIGHKRPTAFMFTFGNLAMRIARSQFSRNFFACAGFEVIDNHGFKTVNEGISVFMDSKAEILVACSSDEEYPSLVPELIERIDDKTILVVAGYPKESLEDLKAAGAEHFIHVRSNILEELKKYQELVGIKE